MSSQPAGAPAQDPDGILADERAEVEILDSELLVRGHVWDVRRDRFRFGGGELVRDYIDHTGAVGVLALDDADNVLVIRQYRHPIGQRDWEIPAGLMDAPGEPGLAAARRELAEEADLAAAEWHLLSDLFLSPGGTSEAMRIFLARGLTPIAHDFERTEEEAELVPRWVPLDELVDAVLAGRVKNAVTANAALAAAASRSRGWATLRDPSTPWSARESSRGERSR
ncbi:NUDIX domain-containing protein [Leucobacter luti]|uniref:NUDIX domain-containing protein n=1 Tax=Leucobacter luti TaxID=340320 RepID=UPI003D04FFB9